MPSDPHSRTMSLDWPAGLVGDEGDEGPEATARKELVSFYRAHSVKKKGGHEEEITVHEIARDEIDSWLRSRGEVMVDLKVWGGLHFV